MEHSAEFLQTVLDALSATIAIVDERGAIVAVNASWRRFASDNGLAWADYGLGRNYLRAMEIASGPKSEEAELAAKGIRQVMLGQQPSFSLEYPCHSPDSQRWFMMWATPVTFADGLGAVIAHEDITARKLSELAADAALREAEAARRSESQQRRLAERRRAIAAGLGDVIAILNSNRSLLEVLGAIADQALDLLDAGLVAFFEMGGHDPLLFRASSQDAERLSDLNLEFIQEQMRTGSGLGSVSVVNINSPVQTTLREPVSFLAVPVIVDEEPYGVLVAVYDQVRTFLQDQVDLVADYALQIALAVGNARLRERARTSAIEAERSRLLRELHDAVSQSLFSASLIADTLPRVWKEHPDEARAALDELRRLTRSALAEMRGLLLDLGPAALTQQSLDVLLGRLAAALSSRGSITIRQQLEEHVALPAPAQVTLYRIAEEALNNVVKHAGATDVLLRLSREPNGVCLVIEDNGRGFSPQDVPPGHLGLGIMRQRAEQTGATIDIASLPGAGTRVAVHWIDHGVTTDASR